MNKLSALFYGVVCVIFYLWLNYSTRLRDEENFNWDFNGRIEKVEYDVKGIPTVKINNQEYYLANGYNFDHKLADGDSLIKKKGSTSFKLIKHNTGEIIVFPH